MSADARPKSHEVMSPAQRGMVALLRAAGRVQRGVSEICERHGVTHDQYNALRILRGVHPQGHPRYEVAARLINRAPDVTRLLDRLEERGLVERVRSDEDRRLSLCRITPKGLRLLAGIDPEVQARHEHLARSLTASELQTLEAISRKLAEAAEP